MDALPAMLAEDVTFTMPALPTWYRGRDVIAVLLTRFALDDKWRLVATRATASSPSGPTPGTRTRVLHPLSLDVLTLDGAIATDITSFVAPYTRGAGRERFATEVFGPFGLPPLLD